VLGVARNATAARIKAAYFQLAKTYHPDTASAGESAAAKQIRADIFGALSAAWGVLGDDQARAHYLDELASGGAAEVDVMAILKAEQVFEMATILVKTRKYEEARAKLEEALKLNPDEPEFAIWKAWADYLLAGDNRKAQQVASANAIEAALKKNSRCMPGYLFLGQMAKLAADPALAEKHFKRGLAIEPRNVDLARELKYLKK
jgi:curved DNA-binding protein CbpA